MAGMVINGFVVLSDNLVICGTAIPTKDIGPARAVTHAESKLESNTIHTHLKDKHLSAWKTEM